MLFVDVTRLGKLRRRVAIACPRPVVVWGRLNDESRQVGTQSSWQECVSGKSAVCILHAGIHRGKIGPQVGNSGLFTFNHVEAQMFI